MKSQIDSFFSTLKEKAQREEQRAAKQKEEQEQKQQIRSRLRDYSKVPITEAPPHRKPDINERGSVTDSSNTREMFLQSTVA